MSLRTLCKTTAIAMFIAVATLVASVAVPQMVAAVDPFGGACNNGGGNSAICQTRGSGADPIAGPNGAIVSITTILAIVAGIVAVIFIIIGAIKYVTSGGDSSSVSSAKSTIIAALIGLVIAALARPIVTFIVGRL